MVIIIIYRTFAASIIEMMKKTVLVLLAIITILSIGCNEGETSERLAQIDTLLVHDKVDSALNQLTNIPLKTIHSQADSAYYFLLLTEAKYRTSGPNPSDSTSINYCVEYYKNDSDNEKQARAYYYKGVTGYSSKSRQNSIFFLKQAESAANETDNLILKHKIYESLSLFNARSFEENLSLSYAKKAFSTAKELDDKERQAIALIYLASNYSILGKKDSLGICIQECLPLTSFITENSRAYLYTRMGELYKDDEPELAKKYLNKAIKIYPQPMTYLALSNIYIKEDSSQKVKALWEGALAETKNAKASRVRIDIFKAMRQQSIEQKDFEWANALADSIMDWQQRYSKTQEQDRILEIQAKYDKEATEKEFWNAVKTWGLGIIALIAAIIGILSYLSYKGMRDKKELAENKVQLDAYTKKAEELESSGKASATEINKLHQKIDELTQRHSGILAKGKELYEAIEQGGTTVRWGKGDFINYLEYYKLKDLPFVNEMETEYERLSPKYIFFAVLEHQGKSDEYIMNIMGISDNTLRSTRSRINSKKR